MTRSRRLLVGFLVVASVDVLFLLGSGLYLSVRYWPRTGSYSRTAVEAARAAHIVAAWGALALTALAVVLVAVRSSSSRRRASFWVGGLMALAGVGYGIATGARLGWDQLALWAVTTGDDVPRGVVSMPDTVKYLIVGGHEVSPGTYSTRVWVHLLLLPAIVVVGLLLLARSARRARPAKIDSGGDDVPSDDRTVTA